MMVGKVSEKSHDDLNIKRMFQEFEHSIKSINHEKISEITGDVSNQAFIDVASTTARLRAPYLQSLNFLYFLHLDENQGLLDISFL